MRKPGVQIGGGGEVQQRLGQILQSLGRQGGNARLHHFGQRPKAPPQLAQDGRADAQLPPFLLSFLSPLKQSFFLLAGYNFHCRLLFRRRDRRKLTVEYLAFPRVQAQVTNHEA